MPRSADPPRSRESATPALDWLDHHPQGAALLSRARQLLRLQQDLAPALPPALARQIRVAQLEAGTLTLLAPGPAQAARLRQITSASTHHLQARGWPVNQIMIRIDATLGYSVAQGTRRNTRSLDDRALDLLAELQKNVAPGPLSVALARMLRHHHP